ncbi:MAG: zinc ABC transporter substrate-binding protein, partial [Planctomycetota bacterium]
MMRHRLCKVFLFAAVSIGVGAPTTGCQRSTPAEPTPTEIEDVVRATSAPVGSFASHVAGGLVRVEMLCPDGQSPATWRPDAPVVARYQQARLIIINGADFEGWVQTAPLPRSRVIQSADAVNDEMIVVKGRTHSHGPGGEPVIHLGP